MSGRSASAIEDLACRAAPEIAEQLRARGSKARNARVGGARAKRSGDAFEAWLDGQHEAAEVLGLAHVAHVGPPHARVKIAGRIVVVVVGDGPADYQGTLRGGRHIALEAKSRALRLDRAHIEKHQADDLDAVHRLGGLALLAVELHTSDARTLGRWVVPWGDVPWQSPRGGRGSVGPEDLAGWEPRGQSYLSQWVTQ